MATTTAKTKKDVDEMSAADRLYDSLSYSYGKKGEKLQKEYNKAYSQADRQALSRGMQRSSWNSQTLANINQQKIDALNDNESALIADYENRLGDIEAREQEQANWQAQFDASREDAAWNKEYQTNQFNWQKEQADRNYNYQVGRDAVADNQWNMTFQANQDAQKWQQGMTEKQFDADQAAQAWQQGMTEKQYADSRADTAWQQNMTEKQYADSRADTAWNQAFTERQYADSRADTAWQQAFSEKQWQAQLDQWNKEFNYTQMSDEQKINYNYVTYALQNGNDVSDDMLRKAGLSRKDFNAMKAEATTASSGGGGYNPSSTSHDDYVDQSGNIYTWDTNSGKYVLKPKSGVNDSSYNSDLFGLGNNTTTPSSTTSNSSLMHEASHTASKLADLLKKNK